MPDSIYLVIVIVALAGLLCAFVYAEWERWDDERRAQRLAHRNLERGGLL